MSEVIIENELLLEFDTYDRYGEKYQLYKYQPCKVDESFRLFETKSLSRLINDRTVTINFTPELNQDIAAYTFNRDQLNKAINELFELQYNYEEFWRNQIDNE
jgi:hypothetical protein